MGLLIKADFKKKIDIKLYRFDPKNPKPEYHAEIFCEMFSQFPQFKAQYRPAYARWSTLRNRILRWYCRPEEYSSDISR